MGATEKPYMTGLEFLKDILKQVSGIWKQLKFMQKMSILFSIIALFAIFGFIVIAHNDAAYVELFPNEAGQMINMSEVQLYIDKQKVPYKVEGNSNILVPKKYVYELRAKFASLNIPKFSYNNKGFELFDTNTWIKGDKELKILEMRALKGQLEKDIMQFDNIENANVILDIDHSKLLLNKETAKGSVILTISPGSRLTQSQIQAIAYHIASAVKGLDPKMIAISDTSGRLYQAFANDTTLNSRLEELTFEENLRGKIDDMLKILVGAGNYFTNVQATMTTPPVSEQSKSTSQITNISIGLLLNKQAILEEVDANEQKKRLESLRLEIEKQIAALVEVYHARLNISIDFVDFSGPRINPIENSAEPAFGNQEKLALLILASAVLAILLIPFFRRYLSIKENHSKRMLEPHLFPAKQKRKKDEMGLEKMIDEIKLRIHENPKSVSQLIRQFLRE